MPYRPETKVCAKGCGRPYVAKRPENTAHTRCPVNAALPNEDAAELKATLRRTLILFEREKRKTEQLTNAVYSAVTDGIRTLEIRPVPAPPRAKPGAGAGEVAVAGFSDLQLAKATPSYDSVICEKRIEEYAEKVMRLTDIQRSAHPVRRLHVWALGDIVEGELIFPGQAHLIDSSLYRQVTVDGPRIVCNFLRRMLSHFEQVHVTWVIGNHGSLGGRARRDYHPETNADRMLGRIVQQIMAGEDRLTWNIPEGKEDSWYAVDDIGGYKTLLIHGDQIDGGLTTENGLRKKVLGWKSGGLGEPFDDVAMAHFHVVKKFTFNTTTVRVFGSPESDNGYAKRALATMSRPSQHLQFVKPGFGVTAEYTVWLQ
jgi:hypothetical protein